MPSLKVVHSWSVDQWVVNLHVNKQCILYKVNTGADVMAIPASIDHFSIMHKECNQVLHKPWSTYFKTSCRIAYKLTIFAKHHTSP